MRFSYVDARIDDLSKPVLALSSTSAGSLAKLVEFGNTGPLKRLLKPALADISSTGRAQMDLNISLPLRRKGNPVSVASAQSGAKTPRRIPGLKVNGSVFLKDNTVSLGRAKVDLESVNGAVGFNTNGIRINNLQALLHGRPVRLNAKTEGKGRSRVTELTMAGPMRASNVLETYNIGLSDFVNGESQWNVSIRIPMNAAINKRDGIKVAAVSGLVGTQLLLPEPLGKPAATSVRLALSGTLKPNNQNPEWLIDYGDNIVRSMVRVKSGRLQSLSARFGGGAPNPNINEGIRLDGQLSALSLDGWVKTVSTVVKGLKPAASPKPILPISAELRVNKLIAGRQSVGRGGLRFNTDDNYINGVIDNQWLSGNIRYPRAHWKKDQAVIARIASIDKRIFDALGSARPGDDGSNDIDPRTLPPIEARISQLHWDKLNLKNLTLRTSPSVSGLKIDTLGFAYEKAQLIGDGYWHLRDPQGVNASLANQHVTKLNLTLQGYDFGNMLSHVGFDNAIREGEGVLTGSLVWPAPAYKPSLTSLVGEMDIDVKNGRILKVEPGAARLVGLFAIQTLPRRLSLDFKDIVLDGLDFETIRGKVQVANGILNTPLVQLNGSFGVVDIVGESNLVAKKYNQRVTVLPRVSAALPVIGLISGGASAGLGVLFAGGFLKAVGVDFDLIGLREYTLTGDWGEPVLTAVPFERVD